MADGGRIVLSVLLACAALLLSGCETWLLPQPSPTPAHPIDSAAPARQRRADEIARSARLGVVQLGVAGSAAGGVGAGAYLGGDLVVTAAHLVPAVGALVASLDGRAIGPASLVRADPVYDLAVLSVPGLAAASPLPLPWGDARALRVGDAIVALSDPTGTAVIGTAGVVLALRRTDAAEIVETDASLAPGAAGGPLVNDRGELVGIGGVRLPGEPARSFAVSSTTARSFIDAVQAGVGSTEASSARAIAPGVVSRFFELVDAGDHKSAWLMLEPEWRARQPYEDFARGFADFRRLRFTPAGTAQRSIVIARVRGTVEALGPSPLDPRLTTRSTFTGYYDVGYRGGQWVLLAGALELSGRSLLRG